MMKGRRRHIALGSLVVLAGLFGAACGDDSADTANTEYPEAVTCNIGGDYSGAVTAEPVDGEAMNSGQSKEFGAMTLTVVYTGEAPDGGHTVRVEVTDEDDVELLRVLYQIGTPLDEIEFSGGHGFTGLHYVTSDEKQLQFWCEPGK